MDEFMCEWCEIEWEYDDMKTPYVVNGSYFCDKTCADEYEKYYSE